MKSKDQLIVTKIRSDILDELGLEEDDNLTVTELVTAISELWIFDPKLARRIENSSVTLIEQLIESGKL